MKKFMKSALLAASVSPFLVQASAQANNQFTSRVYFVIREPSPQLVQRGRRVIEREFAETYAGIPQLQGRPYQVLSDGNQVIISMVTNADMRGPFQEVVSGIVSHLNGQVRTRGGYDLTRTSMEENTDRYLEVVLDESNQKIRSITARAITLRDLLAELKMQFGSETPEAKGRKTKAPATRFSYMIDRECAARQLDWSFGVRPEEVAAMKAAGRAEPPAETLDEAMTKLAHFFKLNVENHQGTYMFSGDCPRTTVAAFPGPVLELLPGRWIQLGDGLVPPPGARPAPVAPVQQATIQPPMVPVNMLE